MSTTDPLAADHARWHAQRLAELCRPDGWLTLVNLVWLDDGDYRIGAEPDCEIAQAGLPARFGTLRVAGSVATWLPAEGERRTLQSDADGPPTVVAHGNISFFLIERDGRLALRLRDAESATRRGFLGIAAFPFDPAWRIEATWDGALARFRHGDGEYALRPQRAEAAPLQFVFADASSGRQTYGGGRFLFATPQDGTLILDFNRAINPPCAFTPFAVCPLPPPENRLPFAVTAGEQTWQAPA